MRIRCGSVGAAPTNLHNPATRAALAAVTVAARPPPGVDRNAWARHTPTATSVQKGEVSWRGVPQWIQRVENHISTCCCSLCSAPSRLECWCGASLIPDMDWTKFKSFFAFVRHPNNLFGHSLDPEDKRSLQKSLLSFARVSLSCDIDKEH